MNIVLSGDDAITWVTRIVVVYLVIDCAENLYAARQYKGVLSWEHLQQHRYFSTRNKLLIDFLSYIFKYKTWVMIIALRGLCAFCLLIFKHNNLIISLCLGLIFIITSLINFRAKPIRAETENRVIVMITGALFLRSLMPDIYTTMICLWFIAIQSCLSYFAAGLGKINNSGWLKGNGIYNIVTTANFTSKKAGYFAINHIQFVKLLTWLTIAIECAFPLILITKTPYGLFFLVWGIVFHFLIALIFKFGKFFIVWMAAYPAILFVIQ